MISCRSPSGAGRSAEWLAKFLDLSSGIPSHDRFNAILRRIKPAEFEKCLLSWITALHEITDGQIVAIDGKTLRRSFDAASSKSAIHMVSAWATANHISLGQVVVDAKSNEITAIPKLLEILEISGALVTIDAMGCQTEIAEKIVAAKADYCLAVKGNQPTLHAGIVRFFDEHLEDDFARVSVRRHETKEKGHGRQETRYYFICPVPEDLPDRSRWVGLKAIGIVISSTQRDGKDCRRRALLHPQQVSGGKTLRRRGARPLGDRKPSALATRRHVPRRSMPHSQRSRGRQLQHPPPHRLEPAEERTDRQGRHQEQTPLRRLERNLPGKSPARNMTYRAIALGVRRIELNTRQ